MVFQRIPVIGARPNRTIKWGVNPEWELKTAMYSLKEIKTIVEEDPILKESEYSSIKSEYERRIQRMIQLWQEAKIEFERKHDNDAYVSSMEHLALNADKFIKLASENKKLIRAAKDWRLSK